MAHDDVLEPADPESEAQFEDLRHRIHEELSARLAVGDDPTTAEGRATLADLVADAVLDLFIVRPRTTPRYRRRGPDADSQMNRDAAG